VVRSNGDLWAMMPNDLVPAGQEIISGPDGHALLELSDTSRVEVFPNSRLVFRAKVVDWKDLMNLILGKVRVHIEKIGGLPNPYRMTSPTALIAVRGTTFDVTVGADDSTTVEVEEGAVDVTHRLNDGKTVRLLPGQMITVYANEPLAQSKVGPRLRDAVKIGVEVAERTIDVMRQMGGTRGVGTTPTTGGNTTASNTPPATVGGTTQAGSGTSNPPSNGRGNGSGNNGDSTSPGTGTGTGTGSGSGSSGGGGGSSSGSGASPSSRPRP